MSTQAVALSFRDLRDFSADNFTETFPLGKAVEITIKTYKSGEESDDEIFKFWATSLFQRYGPSKINDSDLSQLLNLFSSTIEELLNECQELVNKEQNEKLITFINYSLELFNWIHSAAKEFDTNEITAFLCFGLSVINSCLVAFSRQTNRPNGNELLKKSLAIQTLILNIMSDNSKTFCFNNSSESLFTNLISHLCSIGELTPKLDIKTAVETWKSITRLASQNVTLSQSENSPFDDIVWLRRPMSFLINEIGRNVQNVYKEDSLNEPIQQIEKYLKVTNFYLRLLQKLVTDFRHVLFPICEDFLNTLALVLTPPAFIVQTPVQKVVVELIMNGLRELIPFAYRNDTFFERLLSEDIENINTNEAFYEILLEVIELAIRRNEAECLNTQLFDAAFERLIRSPHIFLSTSIYHRFIETFSALYIRFHLEHIEKTLVNCVLQNDILLALTTIDIWSIIFRLSNSSIRASIFSFWRDINEHFTKFSDQLPALFVEALLKNLYSFLTTQEKIEIWNKFNACDLNNDRFLLTIGLDDIPKSSTKESTVSYFVNELIRLLKESSNSMVVDNFYTIVKDLKLLTPITCRNKELIQLLLQYLEIAMKNKKFKILLRSILDFLAPRIDSIDESSLLQVLTRLSEELSSFQDHSTKLCLVTFLKEASKISRVKQHSDQILKIVEKDELIRHLGDLNGMTKVNLEPNDNLLHEILKNGSVANVDSSHVCPTEEEMPVKKKMKTDTDVLLESLEDSVNNLQAMAQCEKMSSSNKLIIRRIVNKLQTIGELS